MILLGVPCSVVSEVCVVQTFVFKVITAAKSFFDVSSFQTLHHT